MKRKILGLAILTCVVAGTASVNPVGSARAGGGYGPTTFTSYNGATAVTANGHSGLAAKGTSTSYIGIFGKSTNDRGVAGSGPTGVYGASQDVNGNMTYGPGTHGGVFDGGAAQLRLVPLPTAGHPTKGQTGDLVLDVNGNLWLCKGGPYWKYLG